MTARRIVLAGGGTGGHIEPMLAVGDALRRLSPGIELTCLGTARGLESTLVPARGYELALIPPVPLPRKLTPDLLSVPTRLLSAVRAARRILVERRAEAVVGFGGYVSLPAYLAARRAGIPVVVHEQNALPGLANRIAARFAQLVAVTFPGTPLRGARVVGMPVRPQIAALDRAAGRAAARREYGLDAQRPALLVFGGSQGARSLNNAVFDAAPGLRERGVQILHAVGPKNIDVAAGRVVADSAVGGVPHVVLPYLERMDLAYAAVDLALCRAGAVTCAELSAVGLPGIFVPLPIGNGEQRRNAAPIVDAGGGLLIEDGDLDAGFLTGEVAAVITDPARLAAMSTATAGLGHRDAADNLAGWILDLIGHEGRTA